MSDMVPRSRLNAVEDELRQTEQTLSDVRYAATTEIERLTARNELLEAVYEAAILVLDEADNAAEQLYEGVSPAYIQESLQEALAAVKE